MRLWHWVVLLAVAAVYFWSGPATTMPEQSMVYFDKNSTEQPIRRSLSCLRNRCLTIYLAPWCPYCKSSHTAILDAVKQLDARGISTTVILGRDKTEALLKYAADFPFPVYLDPNQAYFDQLGMKGVPHWVVWSPGGEIIKNESGGFSSADELLYYLDLEE